MTNFIALAIIVVAVVVAALAGRAAWLRRSGSPSRAASPGGRARTSAAASQGELVAVMAAAVAAASGLEPEAFRVVGVRPHSAGAEGAGSAFSRGLNTPAWGHVDRFVQGEWS